MTKNSHGSRLTVGIIGIGNISETYLRNLTTLYADSIDVRGCADIVTGRSVEAAERWKLPKTYTSVADLLSDSAIEAVVVLTNPVSHFDVCLEAVRAGKHVYVDKLVHYSNMPNYSMCWSAPHQIHVSATHNN